MTECTNKLKKIERQQNRYLWKPENFPEVTLQNREKYENEFVWAQNVLNSILGRSFFLMQALCICTHVLRASKLIYS